MMSPMAWRIWQGSILVDAVVVWRQFAGRLRDERAPHCVVAVTKHTPTVFAVGHRWQARNAHLEPKTLVCRESFEGLKSAPYSRTSAK